MNGDIEVMQGESVYQCYIDSIQVQDLSYEESWANSDSE